MSVTIPPPRPEVHDDRDLNQRIAELDALIEEARRRARRRRRLYGCVILAALGAGAAAYGWGSTLGRSEAGASPAAAPAEAASARSTTPQPAASVAFFTTVPKGRRGREVLWQVELYVMNPDGSGKRKLMEAPWNGFAEPPVWSPDASKLVFARRLDTDRYGGQCVDCNSEVFVANADGSGQRNLTRNAAFDGIPALSPDGQHIAFVSSRDSDEGDVYVMNADGGGVRRLTQDGAHLGPGAWSPDGRTIVFERVVGGIGNGRNIEIYAMNADGSGQRRLTHDPAADVWPAWSPDGRTIAFVSYRDGTPAIYLMKADGTAQRKLTRTANSEAPGSVAWSPDGRKIAFVRWPFTRGARNRDRNNDIYVVNVDGTGLRNLTRHRGRDGHPAWSPDGQRIGFVSNRGGNRDLYVMNADGSGLRNLTRGIRQQAFGLAWSPAKKS
jgi:TolB protein